MIDTCRTTDKIITTNNKVKKVFMEDPIAKFFGAVSEFGDKPYIEVEKKPVAKPLVTQVHMFEPVDLAPISDRVTLPVDNDTVVLKADLQSGNPNLGSGKVIMLGGNDVEFNHLLLDLLGANKLQLPTITERKLENKEMQRPVHLPAAKLHIPMAKKAGKPTLRTRNSRFVVKPQKSVTVLNKLATNDQQLHGVELVKETPAKQIHLNSNSISIPGKNGLESKRQAGKPTLHTDQTSVSKPKQPKNTSLLWKKASKPKFDKPLYSELELIPKGDANIGRALSQRTHINLPVRDGSARANPVSKAKPLLAK